jgi:paraquat-inducible protein A
MLTQWTAMKHAILRCHACDLLLTGAAPWLRVETRCPRCGSDLCYRKPNSQQRTLALVIAAAILYVPANVLPILQSARLSESESDTILSGVVALWADGLWPLAALVFVVSIVIPSLKLITLSLLVLSAHYGWRRFLPERTELYRLIEVVGRWSMLDVFVMALLVTLVQLRSVAIIRAGPAALAFASVVVLTMLATNSFDPRIMWDRADA